MLANVFESLVSTDPQGNPAPALCEKWSLEENGLVVVEDVASSSARLVVNRASYHARREAVAGVVETLRRSSAS